MVGQEREWDWQEFQVLPFETVPCDIHCVTKWSKPGTNFGVVSVDTLLDGADPQGEFVMQYSYGGYTTNLPLADLTSGKAWVVTEHEGEQLLLLVIVVALLTVLVVSELREAGAESVARASESLPDRAPECELGPPPADGRADNSAKLGL